MRVVTLWLLACSLATAAYPAAAKQRYEIIISTTTPTVKLGSAPEVTVTFKNNSDSPLNFSGAWLQATGIDPNWLLEVRDSAGRRVPRKVHKSLASRFGSVYFRGVAPGKSITDHIDLSRLFDLRKPGKYRVQVSREIPKENGGGIVKSNVITITVTQTGPPGRARPEKGPTSGKGP